MKIRLWTLGSLEHKIIPSPQAIRKLKRTIRDAKKKLPQDDSIDIVWGPELTLRVIDTSGGK